MVSSTRLTALVLLLTTGVPLWAATISVTDDLGNRVDLSSPAERIVSLAPHLTEMLFSVGAGDKVVGTVRFSDYPPAAEQIPVLGDAFTINIESIVAMQPDLVVAWHTGGANKVVQKLRQLGIPVYVNEATDLASIAAAVEVLAQLVGDAALGKRLGESFLGVLESIRLRYDRGAGPVVFFQISDQSLYTVNDAHLIGQAIALCGAKNAFGGSEIPVPIVSKESVLAADPDIIVISQPTGAETSPWVGRWSEIDGYEGKIRLIDPGPISRPSLRMQQGIEVLCELVHSKQAN